MPIPAGPIIAAVALASVGIGATVYMRNEDAKKKKAAKAKAKKATPGRAEPVFAENAMLGNSPAIVSSIVLPIELGALGSVVLRMPDPMGIQTIDTLAIRSNEVLANGKKIIMIGSDGKGAGAMKAKQALEMLVTSLSPQATKKAWDALKSDIKINGGVLFDTPSVDLENTVKRVLAVIQPSTNWSAIDPAKATMVQKDLFFGVMLLGELMYQSIWNAYTEQGGGADQGGGGAIPPDGPPMEPSIAQEYIEDQWTNFYGSKPFDGVAQVVGEGTIGSVEGPVYAELKIYSDNKTKSTGNYTGVANFVAANQPAHNSLIVLYNKDVPTLLEKLTASVEGKSNNLG